MLLQEYVRARAAAGGMTEVGVVTVWERPTRVIVTAAFLGARGLLGDGRGPTSAPRPGSGSAWSGWSQLIVVVRRRLRWLTAGRMSRCRVGGHAA